LAASTLAWSCASLIGVDESYTEVTDAGNAAGGSNAGSGGDGGTAGDGGSNAGSGGEAGSIGGAGGNTGSGGGSGGIGGTGAGPADAPTGPEICDNSSDDDGDGRTDCFDRDCDASAACAGKCNDNSTLRCNVVRAGDNTGATGATQRIASYDCLPGDRAGPELAYRFSGSAGDRVFVELYGLGDNLGLFLADAATGAQCVGATGCIAAADDAMGTSPEALSFSPIAGRDYFLIVDGARAAGYSISVQCSSGTGCSPARAIEAGQTIDTSNTAGPLNVTSNITSYSCGGSDLTAPEAAFMFTPVSSGDYRVTVDNPTTNLQLFILAAPNCNSTCLHATSRSTNPASQNEAVTITATANRTYYIVVDGYGVGNFRLGVTAL
jgi:hypothetical protein